MPVRLPDVTALGARPTPGVLQPIVREDRGIVARANQELGREITRSAEVVFKRQAENEVSEFRTRLNQLEIDKIHDPKSGYKTKRGKDAIDGYDGFKEDVAKSIDAEVGKVTNPLARRAASEIATSRRGQIDTWLSDYVGREREVYEGATFENEQKTSRQRAALNPELSEDEARNAGASALARARRLGLPTDVAVSEAQAGIHAAVIDGYMARQEYTKAYEYFDGHRASLGDKADDYAQRTQAARVLTEVTAQSDAIIAKHGTGAKAHAAAKGIADPLIRKNVEAAIEHKASVDEQLRSRAERNVRVVANQKLHKTDPMTPVELVYTSDELLAISRQPGLLETLRSEQLQRMRGLEVQSDPRVVDYLSTLAGTDPQEFLTADISKHYPNLSVQHRAYFEAMQTSLKDPTKQAQVATEQQQITKFYDKLGFKGGDKGDKRRGAFQEKYQADKAAFVAANKREPDYSEREKIINNMMIPFSRGWLEKEVPAFEAKAGDTVPAGDRRLIIDALRIEGIEPTEARITQEYILMKSR